MLIEYIIVFAVVAIAAFVAIKKLLFQLKGRGCVGCNCIAETAKLRKPTKVK